MIVCSATLHSFEVKKMAERLMHFPAWVDLKVIIQKTICIKIRFSMVANKKFYWKLLDSLTN